ncbi:MAG: winged helix-turn-helix domain-containing protein [Candidatus Thermoplasmatota archaeon]|nr:winged helix-turn-helix domain-containing protein [Candidatus Thermoplasmatota archaeon]
MGQQRKITEEFGLHAGRVWQALHDHGPLTKDELLEITCLRNTEFHAAVGWLARENKILVDGCVFCLDETNLTSDIGTHAGNVWKLLQTWREVNVAHISEYLDMEEADTYSALGWLAREGKIHISVKKRD